MTQTVISHYRVLHQLGEGGMGVVYAAEDLRLGREVAIKFLRADEPEQDQWLARFEREARLASALKHPHICTIHELGEQGGRPFIVMELLEGRTIKQMLQTGPLPAPQALEFAIQIAEALAAAHEQGIVHRDIKPANLFVTHGDLLKVLDFGLAKIAVNPQPVTTSAPAPSFLARHEAPEVTATGEAVGTAAYMSPEQATGRPVDARTDIFSFGSVLYEMVTGKRAFPGDTAAVVLQRLINGDVVPPRALEPAIPAALESIIMRALQTDLGARYQTAKELLAELRALARDLSLNSAELRAVSPTTAPSRGTRRWVYASAAVGLVVLAGLGAWRAFSPSRPLTDRDSVLITSFSNTTGDAVFDETLLTALKVQLGQSPFLDIVPDDRISETLAQMGRRTDEPMTHQVGQEICERLRVKGMLEGTISRLGSNFVLTLTATDCESGDSIHREQGEATSAEQVLSVLGALSSSMRTTLGESLPSIRRTDVPIEQATTPSLAALKAYTLGLAERRRGRELESVAFFNQAIELDPDFAAAYTTLSTVYGSLGEWRRSEEYAQLAYDRHKRVSERERLFIEYQYHDRVTGDQDKAAETLQVWKLSYPRDSRPVNALSLIYSRAGRYEQAVAEAREALRRTPGHPFPLSNLALAYRGLGKYDEARKVAGEAVALGVATTPTRRLLYQLGVLAGDGSDAAQLEWARGRPREFDLISAQAQVAAYRGQLQRAAELYGAAAEKALASGLQETAAGFAAHLAWTEALYGDPATVRERVRDIVRQSAAAVEGAVRVPRLRAAAALAIVGLTSEAQEIIVPASRRYPASTLVTTVLVPSVRAAIALQRGRPDETIIALDRARPTETGTTAALIPIYLRAQAYLANREGSQARGEYQRLIDGRGADPFAPMVPLARLGLARAWALDGEIGRSRAAYEQLFELWRDADPDLPILQRARAEYAALPPSHAR